MPTVEIHCRTAPFDEGAPVDDVFISVHNSGGGPALASGTTGAGPNQAGSVSLGILAEGTYEVHVTPALPAKVSGDNLQEIEVSGEDINVFDIMVDTSNLPTSTDNHFCRCSGTFIDIYGKPVSELRLHFSEASAPQLVYYSGSGTSVGVIPKSQLISTDSSGYASVDLLKGHEYSVYMEGYENISRVITVPELAASPLPDVIFPIIGSVEYTHPEDGLLNVASPSFTMTVGDTVKLSAESVHRSGVRVEGLVSVSLDLDSDSEGIVEFALSGGDLEITALVAGAASFTSSRNSPEEGMGLTSAPEIPLLGDLGVTVLPA